MILKTIDIKYFKGLEHVVIPDCGAINALIGKNNSGKSSVLQAIDMAGIALIHGEWSRFHPKLDIKDLFWDAGDFCIDLTFINNNRISISSQNKNNPRFIPTALPDHKFTTIFIQPDPGYSLVRRTHRTPLQVMNHIEQRNYLEINALDILYSIKYYAHRNERGFTIDRYNQLISDVQNYFPDLSAIVSDRTEHDIATLTYEEYGKKLDILYSGTGLKHFLDVLIKTTLSGAKVVLLDEPELGLHPDLQRKFILYLRKLSQTLGTQIFIATHSPVILNNVDTINFYKIVNTKGKRAVYKVSEDILHTLLGDIGIRPSDIFNSDICILVEGATDVIYFEHIIRNLYFEELSNVAIAIIQYGGGAAEAIINDTIKLNNIVPTQKYTLWFHDRDEQPDKPPSTPATKFKNKIESYGLTCHILKNREIEYYFPESLLVASQQGNKEKEQCVVEVLKGAQNQKFTKAVKEGVCVPSGKYLKMLLQTHLTNKDQLAPEIRELVEKTIITWKNEIIGQG